MIHQQTNRFIDPIHNLTKLIKTMMSSNNQIDLREERQVSFELSYLYSQVQDVITAYRFKKQTFSRSGTMALVQYAEAYEMFRDVNG